MRAAADFSRNVVALVLAGICAAAQWIGFGTGGGVAAEACLLLAAIVAMAVVGKLIRRKIPAPVAAPARLLKLTLRPRKNPMPRKASAPRISRTPNPDPICLMDPIAKADSLIEALPYLQAFRGKTFLIKMGGSAMEDPDLVAKVMRDIVFLEVAGINPIVVHGGGKAISAAMEASLALRRNSSADSVSQPTRRSTSSPASCPRKSIPVSSE